jgi:hypothetical protein
MTLCNIHGVRILSKESVDLLWRNHMAKELLPMDLNVRLFLKYDSMHVHRYYCISIRMRRYIHTSWQGLLPMDLSMRLSIMCDFDGCSYDRISLYIRRKIHTSAVLMSQKPGLASVLLQGHGQGAHLSPTVCICVCTP